MGRFVATVLQSGRKLKEDIRALGMIGLNAHEIGLIVRLKPVIVMKVLKYR